MKTKKPKIFAIITFAIISLITVIGIGQTPSGIVFTSSIPARIKLIENVNFNFTVDTKLIANYRYKLDVPGDWLAGLSWSLLKWSDWQTNAGLNVSYSNFVSEGKYTFVIEYYKKNSSKSEQIIKEITAYWEYPEVREEAFQIDWSKVNVTKTQKEKCKVLAAEYKKCYEIWHAKWVYDYNLLKGTTSESEIINKLSTIIINKGRDGLLKWADKATANIVSKILLPKLIYDIIKEGSIDLILVYRNINTNKDARILLFPILRINILLIVQSDTIRLLINV